MADKTDPPYHSYQQEDLCDAFSQLPFHHSAAAIMSTNPWTAWPRTPQTVDLDSDAPLDGNYNTFVHFIDYDPSLSLPHLDFEDAIDSASLVPIEGFSPAASVSTPGISASSLHDESQRLSPTSATTPRISTKEDLEQDPRLRDAIQTVSEYRKSRRRAQNRSAQQAFKERKKRREKELADRIDAAEREYKNLEVQNKRLKEDLERRKKRRSSSTVPSTSHRDT